MNNIKRFRVYDPSERTEKTSYDTIKECVDDLLSNKRDLSLQRYYVEDIEEEIEVDADELISAWLRGERPKDLSFF